MHEIETFSDHQRRHLAHIYASLREHIWAEIEYDRTPDFAPLDREGEEAFWGHIDAALTSLMFAAHPEEAVALDTRCAAGLKPGSTAEPAEAPTSERQFVGEMGDLIGRYIDVQHDYETVLRGIGISAAYVLSTIIRETHMLPDAMDAFLNHFCRTLREITLATVRDKDAAS